MLSNGELPSTPVARSLLKRPLVSTSTPGQAEERCLGKKQRRRWLPRPELETLREPSESPIAQQRECQPTAEIGPVFGRIPSADSCRFSDTFITSSLKTMDICNNVDTSDCDKNEKLSNVKKDKINNKEPETSASSFQAHEQFKKQLNKNKKRKSTSPKHQSPKICKISNCKKIIGFAVAPSKMLASSKAKTSYKNPKHHAKSPKNLCTYKIPHKSPKCRSPRSSQDAHKSPKNKASKAHRAQHEILTTKSPKVSASNPSKCRAISPDSTDQTNANKHKKSSNASDKASANTHQANGAAQALKLSKYPKSPKLRTAARAAMKQHREEIRKEKEKQLEEWTSKMLEEQRREEEREIHKLRQQTVFKAKPIRRYAPLPLVKKRPLTDPMSPNISKRRRIGSDPTQGLEAQRGNV